MFIVRRSHHNPLITPDTHEYWQSMATFNWSPIVKDGKTYAAFRAMAYPDPISKPPSLSTIGMGVSTDGHNFDERFQLIKPENEWEMYGCEDPRIAVFEGRYYIFYTALSGYPFNKDCIKVAVAVSDDLMEIKEKHLVTPFNAKAAVLFPERINGKICGLVTVNPDNPPAQICLFSFDNIEDLYNQELWQEWFENYQDYALNFPKPEETLYEVGAAPIKTTAGWLFIHAKVRNYFDESKRMFGIEAALLDLENPSQIIGTTTWPMLTPERPYELSGLVARVVFPSGAFTADDQLHIYYGAADTTCCRAFVSLPNLVNSISPTHSEYEVITRAENNPIISPIAEHPWECKATFNPAAVDIDGTVYLLYRALSSDNTSVIGFARSRDGTTIDERLDQPIYTPRENYETKKIPDANSGCEDPRVALIDGRLYMFYTAYDGIGPPRVAISSISKDDFINRSWNWSKPALISPEGIDDKDTSIIPEKIDGKYMLIHRIGADVCGDYFPSLDFEIQKARRCIHIFGPRPGMWDDYKVGIAATPIKTEHGWLLFYHGVHSGDHTYRIGAVLLDLHDPTVVLVRTTDPIFEPTADFEKDGLVGNVVFPCGIVVREDNLYIYYGGADRVCGVATTKLSRILTNLTSSLHVSVTW